MCHSAILEEDELRLSLNSVTQVEVVYSKSGVNLNSEIFVLSLSYLPPPTYNRHNLNGLLVDRRHTHLSV